MFGFDVGCTFKKTVGSSALVGPRAREQDLRVIVNAFHGWAHNHGCQISHHPLYTAGAGLEDFEGMERFFSSSNDVAGVVRYASRFHYLQAFDLHFQQWDEDKYVSLSKSCCCMMHQNNHQRLHSPFTGSFLLNNYRQALAIIKENTPIINETLHRLGLERDAVMQWIVEEQDYLTSKAKGEYSQHALECDYLEALQQYRTARSLASTSILFSALTFKVSDAFESALSETNLIGAYGPGENYNTWASKTRQAETRRRHAQQRLVLRQVAVQTLELKLNIERTWHPSDNKYKEVEHYLNNRKFHQALNRLQSLIVQRLFELQKANVPGLSIIISPYFPPKRWGD